MSSISVVITCHNYGRFLGCCISSVLYQTRKPSEIIVVDDNSTDNTYEIASHFKESVDYYRVNYSCAQKTRNYALTKISGDYVIFLDADDYLDNYAVEIFARELDSDDNLKLVYSDRYHCGSYECMKSLGYSYHKSSQPFSLSDLRCYNYISLPSMIRRHSFQGFDERVQRFQDWDAWLSFLQLSTDAKHIPIPLIHVRLHGSNKTVTIGEYTNRLKVVLKHKLPLFKVNGAINSNASARIILILHSIKTELITTTLRNVSQINGKVIMTFASCANTACGFKVVANDTSQKLPLMWFNGSIDKLLTDVVVKKITPANIDIVAIVNCNKIATGFDELFSHGIKIACENDPMDISDLNDLDLLLFQGQEIQTFFFYNNSTGNMSQDVKSKAISIYNKYLGWRFKRVNR